MKRIIGLMAVVAVLALTGAAMAEDNWHGGAYDEKRGTNFANPTAYQRMVPVQGAGGDSAGGDAGTGDAGAAAGSGSTGGDSGGNGDGCSK